MSDSDTSRLKAMIERALNDGALSREESQAIKSQMYADKEVTPEESELFRELQDKIWKGEIRIDS